MAGAITRAFLAAALATSWLAASCTCGDGGTERPAGEAAGEREGEAARKGRSGAADPSAAWESRFDRYRFAVVPGPENGRKARREVGAILEARGFADLTWSEKRCTEISAWDTPSKDLQAHGASLIRVIQHRKTACTSPVARRGAHALIARTSAEEAAKAEFERLVPPGSPGIALAERVAVTRDLTHSSAGRSVRWRVEARSPFPVGGEKLPRSLDATGIRAVEGLVSEASTLEPACGEVLRYRVWATKKGEGMRGRPEDVEEDGEVADEGVPEKGFRHVEYVEWSTADDSVVAAEIVFRESGEKGEEAEALSAEILEKLTASGLLASDEADGFAWFQTCP